MRRITLWFRRCLVFGLGLASVWLIVFVFLDIEDRHRVPWFLGLAISYGSAAYLILPWTIRTSLRILHRGRVPSYTTTGDGLPGDPVNIVLVGTRSDLDKAFAEAGWFQADRLGAASSWRMVTSFLFNRPYPTAPFSTLYLFGRGQDVGFQKPIGNSPRKRHHVRFWGMPLSPPEEALDSADFWLAAAAIPRGESALWVGAGTRDTGISLTRLSFQITHATDADTNAERDFLVAELSAHGSIRNVHEHLPGERLQNGRVNRYVTDGQIALADLVG